MSMWETDNLFAAGRIDEVVGLDEPFELLDLYVAGTIEQDSDLGMRMELRSDTKVTHLVLASGTYSTLATGIAQKAALKQEGDLPAKVKLTKVPSKFGQQALVIRQVTDK